MSKVTFLYTVLALIISQPASANSLNGVYSLAKGDSELCPSKIRVLVKEDLLTIYGSQNSVVWGFAVEPSERVSVQNIPSVGLVADREKAIHRPEKLLWESGVTNLRGWMLLNRHRTVRFDEEGRSLEFSGWDHLREFKLDESTVKNNLDCAKLPHAVAKARPCEDRTGQATYTGKVTTLYCAYVR